MPTYDYECQGCGYKFELFQNMTSDPIKNCPKCQGPVKRLIGAGAGIIFKGSGFYETDYKKKKEKKEKEESKDKKPPACPMSKDCSASQCVNASRRDPAERRRDAARRDKDCSASKE